MKSVYILPTGDEIKNNTVLDLDSSEIMRQVVRIYPCAQVTRLCPISDVEDAIFQKIKELVALGPDLLVLIGGSGGGHRFSNSLGKDFTHSALDKYLDENASREIYGKNGHMWTKLICGKKENTILINVPGPFVEAQAACNAFLESFSSGKSLDEANYAMAKAVFDKYPTGAVKL